MTSENMRKAADLSDEIAAKQAELATMLPNDLLKRAADLSDEIVAKQQELSTLVGDRSKKRVLSPEALEKIREGQRVRWAKVHAAVAAAAKVKKGNAKSKKEAVSMTRTEANSVPA